MSYFCVQDYEEKARLIVSPLARDYVYGGSENEFMLKENLLSFQRWRIKPRILKNVAQVDTSCDLLGQRMNSPIHIAPMAEHCLVHPEGEIATAQGAAKWGCCFTLSTFSTKPLDKVKAMAGSSPCWLQGYIFENRALNETLIKRAIEAGYEALVLTVDAPILGQRRRDLRNKMSLPPHLDLANFPKEAGVVTYSQLLANDSEQARKGNPNKCDASLTWEILIPWINSVITSATKREGKRLKIILKGILTKEDALLACDWNVDAIWLSNHGGRQLDSTLAPIDVVQEISRSVRAHPNPKPIFLDSGVRHGSDVFKALALGADAVFVGRPILSGLACEGKEGVAHVLQLLNEELKRTMMLAGCAKLQDITTSHVCKAPGYNQVL